jgi:hypothetical protein
VSLAYQGFEDIGDKSSKQAKLAFMRQAMKVLDDSLDYDLRCRILETCACCLGGSRAEKVKQFKKSIAGQDLTLAQKVELLRQARPFYNATTLTERGTIRDGSSYEVDGKYRCACTTFSKERLVEPISATYCLCCAGHYRHHIEGALAAKLKTKRIISSPLASMGKEPCAFEFEIIK